MQPFDRRRNESAQAHAAFCAYRDLGAERSIAAAWRSTPRGRKNPNRTPKRWKIWSSAHDWVERARAYDGHLGSIELAAREQALMDEAEKWAKRKIEQRERDYVMAEQLHARALEMLAFPLTETVIEVDEEGHPVRIIRPMRWTLADAARLADVASKLGRLALDMPTDRHEVGITREQAETMSLEELDDALRERGLL